jgi:hypothetical protein
VEIIEIWLEELESALAAWFKKVADRTGSDGWIVRFKRRHNSVGRTAAGEGSGLISEQHMTGKMTDCCNSWRCIQY